MSDSPNSADRVCTYDPLIELMARFENVKATASTANPFEGLTTPEALQKHIVDGIKKGLEPRLDQALQELPALEIINNVLLEGMKTVGELFGAGKMQLPFVLQSAEVMKASVRYLEPHLDRLEGESRGSILLATVAGDVHDIGKNLVDIILSNNGYRVVNIGIKQPINAILEQAQTHRCDVIGMSGLLVKSTVIMRENLLEMNSRGLSDYPVILGGAALTRGYVEQDLRQDYDGRVFYAQDAFEGLKLMAELCENPSENPEPAETQAQRTASHRVDILDDRFYVFTGQKSDIEPLAEPPQLPFYGAKKNTTFDVFEIYKYINPIALFRGQWQFKRPEGMANAQFNDYLNEHALPVYERLTRELAPLIKPKVAWGYYPCSSDGNDLIIYQPDQKTEKTRFTFPRQLAGKRLCLADFFLPEGLGPNRRDTVGFSLVTVGDQVTAKERELFKKGDFQDYLFTHGLGVETAEALAEYWHRQMRMELKIDDQEPADMKLLFSAKYHGARYSFGYPACPNLEDQSKLFELLKPEEIGVELSDEYMLIPEQSTSAVVVHHPAAKYFNVR